MNTRAEPWTPPTGMAVVAIRAGEHWDAVKVSAELGNRALARLGDASGAVISDGHDMSLYWLLRPGAADGWNLPHVRVLGGAGGQIHYVPVPGTARTARPGPHWRVPHAYNRHLTDGDTLRAALTAAAGRHPREGRAVTQWMPEEERRELARLATSRKGRWNGHADGCRRCSKEQPGCPHGRFLHATWAAAARVLAEQDPEAAGSDTRKETER